MLNPMRDENEGTYRGREGRHLWPRFVHKIAEDKTSYESGWILEVMIKKLKSNKIRCLVCCRVSDKVLAENESGKYMLFGNEIVVLSARRVAGWSEYWQQDHGTCTMFWSIKMGRRGARGKRKSLQYKNSGAKKAQWLCNIACLSSSAPDKSPMNYGSQERVPVISSCALAALPSYIFYNLTQPLLQTPSVFWHI